MLLGYSTYIVGIVDDGIGYSRLDFFNFVFI